MRRDGGSRGEAERKAGERWRESDEMTCCTDEMTCTMRSDERCMSHPCSMSEMRESRTIEMSGMLGVCRSVVPWRVAVCVICVLSGEVASLRRKLCVVAVLYVTLSRIDRVF